MTDAETFSPLWGEWYLKEMIGQGTFGAVYKAEKTEYGNTYVSAIKHLSIPPKNVNKASLAAEGIATDERSLHQYCDTMRDQIIREINFCYSLRGNTNIVAYEDHCILPKKSEIGYDIFIRMELMTRLPELVRSRFPSLSLSAGEVRKLGMDICRALTYCENNKIRGLEINPENLFIDRFGNYKIGVFSIAHYQESDRPAHNRAGIGAVSYLPPEVSSGDIGSSTSDTYSLGLVLYELLNEGRSPFLPLPPLGCSSSQVDAANMRRFHGEPLPPPAQADPGMWKIIKKACEHLPENRYQSAGEFYAALSAYRMSEGSPASSQETSGSGTESVSASAAVHSASSPVMGSGQDETLRSWDDTVYRWEDTAFSDPVQQEFPDPYQTKREEDFSQEIPPSELSPESRNKPSQYNRGPAQQTKTGETQSDPADVPGTTTAGVPGEGRDDTALDAREDLGPDPLDPGIGRELASDLLARLFVLVFYTASGHDTRLARKIPGDICRICDQ